MNECYIYSCDTYYFDKFQNITNFDFNHKTRKLARVNDVNN